MRKMKDSGIEWIEEIPEEWECVRGKYTLEYLQRPVRKDDDVITCFRDGEVTLRSNRREDGFTMSDKEIGYQGVDVGDLVVHGMDGFAGAIGISDSRGKASPVLNVLNTGQSKRYIMYYLRSMAYSDVFTAIATGIRVRSCDLRWNKLAELPYPVPPLSEQKNIADHLDSKCSEIDGLVSDIEKQITTLEQYKRSVITEAVTKGLDPAVPMKDSGIEWIGNIPEEWNPIRLKYIANYNTTTLTENTNADYEFDYIDIGSVTYGKGIEQFQPMKFSDAPSRARRVVKPHDVIVSTVRTYLKAIAYVPEYDRPVVVSTGFLTLTAKPIILPKFLRYAVESEPFVSGIEANSVGISYPAINTSEAVKVTIILPPFSEQQYIADYLDTKCSEIDSAISLKKQQIETLNDYKKSLIYEYVTGKKEIPA